MRGRRCSFSPDGVLGVEDSACIVEEVGNWVSVGLKIWLIVGTACVGLKVHSFHCSCDSV